MGAATVATYAVATLTTLDVCFFILTLALSGK